MKIFKNKKKIEIKTGSLQLNWHILTLKTFTQPGISIGGTSALTEVHNTHLHNTFLFIFQNFMKVVNKTNSFF